eukprot:g21786.t1
MRSAWKEVVDEMLDADAETSDEIVLTVRRQWAKQPQMPGDAPVGIFDSGVGGLTVYRRLRERWPMADAPEDVARYVEHIAHYLRNDTQLTLIACNTASVAAIAFNVAEDEAFAKYPILPIAPPYGVLAP